MAETKKPRELDRALQVRVADQHYRLFEKAASRDGRSLSNWARERLIAAAKAELAKPARGGPQ